MKFRALVVRKSPTGGSDAEAPAFVQGVEERDTSDLPPGELLVRVLFSSLNYKDALSATGNSGVTKRYPHTPGIDAVGVVAESTEASFREGDEVLITGFDLGMNTPGGFGEYVRVPAPWALRLPAKLSMRDSMTYGTAGLTAAIAVDRLGSTGVVPGSGRILVTGAKGGVGGFAVAILSRIGYEVEASTGSDAAEGYLRALGAVEIVPRASLEEGSSRPLLHARWAGAVDTVGGTILSTVIKSIDYGGAIAACGNAASGSFDGSVYPFILRGVSLLGIESAGYPLDWRADLWERLAEPWNVLDRGIQIEECALAGLPGRIAEMAGGNLRGRVLVDLSK